MTDRPRIAVVVFPGSNDDRDAALALEHLGADAPRVWHTDEELPRGTAAVVLPGGFSYGDYLRCGAIARFSPVMRAVGAFAAEGGLVLGICNGFQILTEAGLLPGRPAAERVTLVCVPRRAARGRERRHAVHDTLRTPARSLTIPVKHGDGCWFADAELLAELEHDGQIVLRYGDGREPERRRSATSRASRTPSEPCSG